jgi:signal transduction histidine kinase
VLVVIVGGLAATAVRVPSIADWSGREVAAFLIAAAAVALSEQFWVEVRHGDEGENFSVTDAVFAAGILLLSPAQLILAVAVGATTGQLVRRIAPHKIAFNVGQFVLGLTVAEAIFRVLHNDRFDHPVWLLAAVGLAAYFVVNTVSVALVIAFTTGDSLREILLPSLPLSALHWAGNIALGLLAALVWKAQPSALPLLLIPIGLSYLTYRGWLRSAEAGRRMSDLARAAASISTQGDLARRLPSPDRDGDIAVLASTLNRMLAQLQRAFDRERRFISEASHELRTPLTICRGHLDVLEAEPSADDLRETVAVVTDELARMGRLVDELTLLERTNDIAVLHREPIEIDRLVHDVSAKATPLLNGRLQIAPLPGHASAVGDRQRLTQALLNLLQNAAVHTDSGEVVLRAVPNGAGWRFEVSDEGGGLPAGEEDAVFRPFYRCAPAGPGSGLGLAIVRAIAEAHGGKAGAVNRPGVGVTFWIDVPS